MAIEFRCSGCSKLLRVGDEFAGKKSRCPECGNIQDIPGDGSGSTPAGESPFAGESPMPGAPFAGSPGGAGSAPGHYSSPTSTSPTYGGSPYPSQAGPSSTPPAGVNPYADRPDYSYNNPYRSPAGGYAPAGGRTSMVLTERAVRSKVEGPAMAIIIISVLSLLLIGLFVLVFLAEAANKPDSMVAVVGLLICGVAKLVTLIGAVQMRNLRSYPLAMTAAVLSVIPCMCWLLEVPFGIWAIVVLADNTVRRAFQS